MNSMLASLQAASDAGSGDITLEQVGGAGDFCAFNWRDYV